MRRARKGCFRSVFTKVSEKVNARYVGRHLGYGLQARYSLSEADRTSDHFWRRALPLLFPQTATELIHTYRHEFINAHKFFDEFYRKTTKVRSRRPDLSGKEFLYVLIRIAKPRIRVRLFFRRSTTSIDLPATATIIGSTDGMKETELPPDCIPGWSIPDYLRDRPNLILGDSKEILQELVAQYSPIDIFIHDSLHTYAHMYFEYKTAWPNLSDGGFLLSDDVHWNHAFHEFCRGQRRPYLNLGELGVVMK